MNKVHYSSKTIVWETPQDLFNDLDKVYNFETDVCALKENAKCKKFYSPLVDGLKQEWKGICWMNPPYGREIGEWIKKASESAKKGSTIVSLLPARTDTIWFHKYIYKQPNVTIEFIKGRLKFGASKNPAPFPSMIVVFNKTI